MSEEQPSTAVALFWRDWTAPKDGSSPGQNEDACSIRPFRNDDGSSSLLIAVADGATEAIYSRLWARELVEAAQPDWPALPDSELNVRLQPVRRRFSPLPPGEQVPYYVRNKFLAQGSQAALLVLSLTPVNDADAFALRAISVGDCCLFLFGAGGEFFSFPMHASEDFGANPNLVTSRSQVQIDYDHTETLVRPGDLLVCCTDAVAKYVLQRVEDDQAGSIFELLIGLLTPKVPEPDRTVEEPPADPSPQKAESTPTEVITTDDNGAENATLLVRLWELAHQFSPWRPPPEPLKTDAQDRHEPELSETVTPPHPAGGAADVTAVVRHPATPEADRLPSNSFEQFIARCRVLETKPMRNDDSTLVVCLPVQGAGESQQREALGILRNHLPTARRSRRQDSAPNAGADR